MTENIEETVNFFIIISQTIKISHHFKFKFNLKGNFLRNYYRIN